MGQCNAANGGLAKRSFLSIGTLSWFILSLDGHNKDALYLEKGDRCVMYTVRAGELGDNAKD
jgi:hypothetical protein